MLPAHLKRYVVEQDYGRYTAVDQEVWRYIMRQLSRFLGEHAHPCYLEGLKKTGIELDRIPNIAQMSSKLEKFGWQAIPVSGFIPPAAFMEIQAHGYLPIASDMRSVEHMAYTPAPDIVHEAAGHAPILVDPEFAGYLKSYAQIARKAIISHEDLAQYEAIRILSDIKEDPSSTPEAIEAANERLKAVNLAISHISEAALLGRMNWWTAEYGLIGDMENPRIFGAGLLSSIGEARGCLKPQVRKIALSIDCINFSYDITEPQPQLFVTPSFAHLTEVLNQLAKQMAFSNGGAAGLEKALAAKTVNTAQLNSGVQISGVLNEVVGDAASGPAYLRFSGPVQLSASGRELSGQGRMQHPDGFGSPVGTIIGASKCLSEMSESELRHMHLRAGEIVDLRFTSGVIIKGQVTQLAFSEQKKLLVISFKDCRVMRGEQLLFDPAWGSYDVAVGSKVISVFGGPADRDAFGETGDFAAKVIPRKPWAPLVQLKHRLYGDVRRIREDLLAGRLSQASIASSQLEKLLFETESSFPNEWLLRLSLLELAQIVPSEDWQARLREELAKISGADPQVREQISDGFNLLQTAPL